MDSNTLEKERGITILSKVTSVAYNTADDKTMKINIVGMCTFDLGTEFPAVWNRRVDSNSACFVNT